MMEAWLKNHPETASRELDREELRDVRFSDYSKTPQEVAQEFKDMMHGKALPVQSSGFTTAKDMIEKVCGKFAHQSSTVVCAAVVCGYGCLTSPCHAPGVMEPSRGNPELHGRQLSGASQPLHCFLCRLALILSRSCG